MSTLVGASGWDAWIAAGTVAAVFAAMAATRVAPYLLLLGGLAVLLVAGVIGPGDALAGFANEGVATVGLLFVVAAGLRETGVLDLLIVPLLGRPRTERGARGRLIAPVAAASAFLNNTPLVAMMLPVVLDWARRARVPASKLLIPLSYASILGGMCTLIGTSANLVVNGMLIDAGHGGLGLFDLAAVGVPCAVVGLAYLWLGVGPLLPARGEVADALEDPREYTVEMVVAAGSPLAGKTVEQAGLRSLPGVFLAEIHRGGRVIPAVGPGERLEAGDQLVFVGLVDSVVDLQKRPGLVPATEQVFKLDAPRADRWFIEAVVSHRCPIVGNTIRDGAFRTRYNAVVIAVARGGERIDRKIGDIVLQPGDVLLLEAPPAFVDQHRNSNDFYLVSRATDAQPPRHDRAWLAVGVLAAMIALVLGSVLSMFVAALCAAGAMLLLRCCNEEAARRSVDWQVLLAIAAAFGLGRALDRTGAASAIAHGLVGVAGDDAWWAFAAVCIATTLLTEVVTNAAAAVVMVPIALQTAAGLGADPMPFVVGIMISASAAFATPLGYQTNLMVYGPGGYRLTDFVRAGVPLSALVLATNIALTPRVWPF
ncbi:MAG: SLC13 family permease [Deltaproteobacteria bacterium]|nr:MAG: SLC13 family permease [Deltaproteobacteria bacterium]